MPNLLSQHIANILPESKMREYMEKLKDELATALSTNSHINHIIDDWTDLTLEDMLVLSFIINEGVVVFSPSADVPSDLNANFVGINDADCNKTVTAENSFEKELASLELAESPGSPCKPGSPNILDFIDNDIS